MNKSHIIHQNPLLNRQTWAFCLRSLFREYGLLFTFHIIARHPIRTLIGINRYRKNYASMEGQNYKKQPLGKKSIVGVGFCLKPLDPPCLSGRSNHQCHFLKKNLHQTQNSAPKCCKNCTIKSVGLRALSAGNHFYIMTSAKDILLDMLKPALQSSKFNNGLFLLCRYSFEPFKIALSIAGISGRLFPFNQGDCTDYKTWLLADIGIKEEQTQVAENDFTDLVDSIPPIPTNKMVSLSFNYKDHIFQNHD